jgi:gluconolactonase
MRILALSAMFAAALLQAQQPYTLGPDSQPQAGVPKGVVTKFKLAPGKFYPGTPHNCSLYVPAQYDASKPTAFMIFLDGGGAVGNGVRVPVVFDNLIAKQELPPMIGIFIDPGTLPALSDQAQSRFERVFEYDSLSDRLARFLLEELIPEVAKNYNLSKDPNDRGLYGVSTGAVGAFAAAWNRPDQFRRVLSLIGTYVAMKGADGLPALIRKTEPKPIRFFLQDGKADHVVPGQPYGTFYAGSWPINNQVMYEAMEAAGYDAKLVLGEDGHSSRHGAAILPDALRWLWRGYPAPIVAHEPAAMTQPGWDPRGKVYSIVSADQGWEQVAAGTGTLSSPAPDADGNVYAIDAAAGRIYKSDAAGKTTVLEGHTAGAHSLAVGPGGKVMTKAADGMAITAKGAVYFSDAARRSVSYTGADGKTRVVYQGGDRGGNQGSDQGGEIARPTGLALSPDQAMLVVTDAQSRFSWSFQIAADGGLVNGEPFYRLEMPEEGWMSEVTGAVEDSIGQVYFASAIGIQVCEANGRVAAILNAPEPGRVTGIAFGGKQLNWLYATEGGKLFRRPAKVNGVGSWAPAKLPKPPL